MKKGRERGKEREREEGGSREREREREGRGRERKRKCMSGITHMYSAGTCSCTCSKYTHFQLLQACFEHMHTTCNTQKYSHMYINNMLILKTCKHKHTQTCTVYSTNGHCSFLKIKIIKTSDQGGEKQGCKYYYDYIHINLTFKT